MRKEDESFGILELREIFQILDHHIDEKIKQMINQDSKHPEGFIRLQTEIKQAKALKGIFKEESKLRGRR